MEQNHQSLEDDAIPCLAPTRRLTLKARRHNQSQLPGQQKPKLFQRLSPDTCGSMKRPWSLGERGHRHIRVQHLPGLGKKNMVEQTEVQ